MENNLQRLIDDPDVAYDLSENALVAEILNDTYLANLLRAGEIKVDFKSLRSEIILLYQTLMQLRSDDPEVIGSVPLGYSGFRLDAIDVVRKIVKDIANLKKMGKEIQDTKQVNKELFEGVLRRLAFAVEKAVSETLEIPKRELIDAILMKIWEYFAEPELKKGTIESGVENTMVETTDYEVL